MTGPYSADTLDGESSDDANESSDDAIMAVWISLLLKGLALEISRSKLSNSTSQLGECVVLTAARA